VPAWCSTPEPVFAAFESNSAAAAPAVLADEPRRAQPLQQQDLPPLGRDYGQLVLPSAATNEGFGRARKFAALADEEVSIVMFCAHRR